MELTAIAVLVNFVLLVGVIYFASRKSFKSFIGSRHDVIKKEMEEARQAQISAGEIFARYQGAFSNKEAEIASQREDFTARLTKLKAESLARAEREVSRIHSESEMQVGVELVKQKEKIESQVLQRSLAQARAYLAENSREEEEKYFLKHFLDTKLNGAVAGA